MKEQAYVQLKQMAGKLMYHRMRGTLADMAGYFEHSDCVKLYIPDRQIDCVGYEAVRTALANLDATKTQWVLPILHSDAVTCSEDEKIFYGHWNTYTFFYQKSGEIRMGYHRIEMIAIKKETYLKIHSLSIIGLLYLKAARGRISGEMPKNLCDTAPVEDIMALTPEDYIAIRGIFNRYLWAGPMARLQFLSRNAVIDLASVRNQAAEEETLEKYRIVTAAGDPVIVVHGNRARGLFCAYSRNYGCRKTAGVQDNAAESLQATLCEDIELLEAEFEMTRQGWKILNVQPHPLLIFDAHVYDNEKCLRYIQEVNEFGRQEPPQPVKNISVEDYFVLESVLPQWTERLKRGDLPDFVDKFMKNSFYDLSICLSKSYYGYDQVTAHANRLINEQVKDHQSMKKFPQFHTGNSPIIEVSKDGMEAEAAWLDYGWGNIGAGVYYGDHDIKRKYFPGIGVYYHKFIRENGQWRLFKFGWKPVILGLHEIEYDVNETGGWSNAETPQQWPLPFEDFRYPEGVTTKMTGGE